MLPCFPTLISSAAQRFRLCPAACRPSTSFSWMSTDQVGGLTAHGPSRAINNESELERRVALRGRSGAGAVAAAQFIEGEDRSRRAGGRSGRDDEARRRRFGEPA